MFHSTFHNYKRWSEGDKEGSHKYKMVELVYVKTSLRAILFTALLIAYSVMYLEPALNQYSKKDKTIAQKREDVTHPESPVLVLCPDPPFKKSYFKQFGKNKTVGAERYFWINPTSWKMVENYPSTAMDIYMNMSYQLGLDWNISLYNLEKYVFYVSFPKVRQNEKCSYGKQLFIVYQY